MLHVHFRPNPSPPATRTTNIHRLYSMLHVHLRPQPASCYKNNKHPSTLFIVACSFEPPSTTSTTDLNHLYSMLHVHLRPHPTSRYKNNKHPLTLFNVACSFETTPPLPSTRTTNIHQLYSSLHIHLRPHPRFLLQEQQTSISSSLLHVHLRPHPASCYKNNKHPSTLFNVACSFETPSPLTAARTTKIRQLYSLLHAYLRPHPRFLLQEQHTSFNSFHCCMFI